MLLDNFFVTGNSRYVLCVCVTSCYVVVKIEDDDNSKCYVDCERFVTSNLYVLRY